MGPLIPLSNISPDWNLLAAFIIGIGFGFVLEQAGFSSSRKLAGMFYGYDTTVVKVFFTAAITAAIGLLFFNYFGLIDLSIVYVSSYYVYSAIIGGVIMGAGFIIGGFCPGTSVCAAAIGKIDAMFFIFGSALGVLIFGEGYPLWKSIYVSSNLGPVKLNDFFGVSAGVFTLFVIIAAVFMFWIAEIAEKKYAREDITKQL
ncbi:MAG: YeeE/YedE family protein [Bacteroidetes bacterium]|nr:YeeE/YedE family protein [Bacteroidota bacterium]